MKISKFLLCLLICFGLCIFNNKIEASTNQEDPILLATQTTTYTINDRLRIETYTCTLTTNVWVSIGSLYVTATVDIPDASARIATVYGTAKIVDYTDYLYRNINLQYAGGPAMSQGIAGGKTNMDGIPGGQLYVAIDVNVSIINGELAGGSDHIYDRVPFYVG